MAEFKRDKRIFRAFHSTDADALDILMGLYDDAYPEMDAFKRAEIKTQAQEAIDAAQTQNSWFLVSPERQIQLVPALPMALAYEDVENDVWYDVQTERVQQMTAHGYTPEHDDAHGGDHLIEVAKSYLEGFGETPTTMHVRHEVIKSIATLVALVEYIDRAEASALVAKLEVEEEIEKLEQTEPFNSDPYSDPS